MQDRMTGGKADGACTTIELNDMRAGQAFMREARGCAAEREIESYLQKCGLLIDKQTGDQEKAERDRHRRYLFYQSIQAFLDNYRKIYKTYIFLKENFVKKLEADGMEAWAGEGADEELFTRLSQHLELLSARDERRFENQYRPQIAMFRRFEMAISSLRLGLQILQAENPAAHEQINFVYIQGDQRPTIKEAISELGLAGSSSYYLKLEKAQLRLSELVFGYCVSKEDLFDVLILLKQQCGNTPFPDI